MELELAVRLLSSAVDVLRLSGNEFPHGDTAGMHPHPSRGFHVGKGFTLTPCCSFKLKDPEIPVLFSR